MTRLTLFTALVCLIAFSSRVAADPARNPARHVRYTDDLIAATVVRGTDSPLFTKLLAIIERSDVIVYIERGACRGRGTGKTEFITAGSDVRYARITVNIGRAGDPEAALLGHELQHVVELTLAPWVRDVPGYRALYESIGYRAGGVYESFETAAALDMGWSILEQLRRHVSLRATH